GLAGPVRADQADDLAPVQLERYVSQGVDACKRARDGGGPERLSGPPVFRVSSGQTDPGQGPTVAGVPALTPATALPLFFCTPITRYERPKTVWYFAEKLIGPEIVGSPRKRWN